MQYLSKLILTHKVVHFSIHVMLLVVTQNLFRVINIIILFTNELKTEIQNRNIYNQVKG